MSVKSAMKTLGGVLALGALVAGCGHYLIPGAFQPLPIAEQKAPGEDTRMDIFDDGTVTYVQNRLEVSVRPMTALELDRQFSIQATDVGGPEDEQPTTSLTYGTWEHPTLGKTARRFSVFRVTVKNYEYPKVKFDPLKTTIQASNGRIYYPLGEFDFEEYFRRFPVGFNGLGYSRFNARRDMIKRSKYPDDEFVFSGQEVEGYIIYPALHNDVAEVTVQIPDLGIRYDFRNAPVESVALKFRFKRELKKVKSYDEVEVAAE